MWALLSKIKSFVEEEDAPTMLEYALLLAGIALVAAAAVTIFGEGVKETLFDSAVDCIDKLI